MILDPTTAAELNQLAADHHTALLVNLFGEDVVPKATVDRLRALGLLGASEGYPGTLKAAHSFGLVLAALEDPLGGPSLSLAEVRAKLAAHPVPRTAVEVLSAQDAALRGATAIRGLGNKVGAHLDHTLIEADAGLRRDMRDLIRDAVGAKYGDADAQARLSARAGDRGLDPEFFDGAFRNTVREVASDIGHASGDWARDLQRIAQTESHNAMQHGMAEHFKEQLKGQPVLVYKSIRPTACKHCVRFHTDAAGNPRIFLLSDLEANGTNVGRKTAAWQPVVGSVHPWCACQLVRVPRFLEMPAAWMPGESAPTVVNAEGVVV